MQYSSHCSVKVQHDLLPPPPKQKFLDERVFALSKTLLSTVAILKNSDTIDPGHSDQPSEAQLYILLVMHAPVPLPSPFPTSF